MYETWGEQKPDHLLQKGKNHMTLGPFPEVVSTDLFCGCYELAVGEEVGPEGDLLLFAAHDPLELLGGVQPRRMEVHVLGHQDQGEPDLDGEQQ